MNQFSIAIFMVVPVVLIAQAPQAASPTTPPKPGAAAAKKAGRKPRYRRARYYAPPGATPISKAFGTTRPALPCNVLTAPSIQRTFFRTKKLPSFRRSWQRSQTELWRSG